MRVVAGPTASVAKTAARLRGKHPITRGLAARIFPGVSRRAARYEIALGRAGLTVVPAVAGLVLASVLAASLAVGGGPDPVAGTAAVAFRPARGIEILQNDVGAFTLIGRVLKARCSIGEGGLFTLTGNSTNGRLSLELVIPGFQGFGRDYDVLDGSAAATVSVLDRETNQDYDNAYPVPDAPPGGTIFAGAVRFSGRHARMAFGIIGLPNPDYTATLQIRGGVRCRYVKPSPARAAA